jgi:hypothetical protein
MAHGLEAVMKLVEDNKIDGVHGPLIELFSADDKVRVAVDVTAGNRYAVLPFIHVSRNRLERLQLPIAESYIDYGDPYPHPL